jgi:tetratricopeptide (TPR) repeat protein
MRIHMGPTAGRYPWPKWCALAVGVLLFLLAQACSRSNPREQLEQHRNLGKAFYENPATQQDAVREFQAALALRPDSPREKVNYALALLRAAGHDDQAVRLLQEAQRQDPSLPHTWFNLGIYYKKRGAVGNAITQFEGFIRRAPEEPVGHYQLGALYRQVNRNQEAQTQFEQAARMNPLLAAARFQLYNLNRLTGNPAEADRYLAEFQRIHTIQKSWVIPEDVDWCAYAEIDDPPQARPVSPDPAEPAFSDTQLDGSVDSTTAGLTLIDSTASGRTDLLAWSLAGIHLYLRGERLASATGLEGVTAVLDVAPGDFDNDGWMDLCVLTTSGPALYRNDHGKFVHVDAALPARRFERAVWLDYDHDYDLDLVLLGDHPALVRNQGQAGWLERTDDFPFVSGPATAAQKLRVLPDSKAFDLAVFYRDRPPVLYRDQLGGHYTVEPFQGKAPNRKRADADFGGDGRPDRALIESDDRVHQLRNLTAEPGSWIGVRLTGVRSLKLAQDALVEIKAGTLYRRAFYTGVPLLFDAGDHAIIDTVRITWPNGLIQNEIRQTTSQTHTYTEAQRLSGSCPMVWTWNGSAFEFITDVLGVAPLGASDGDGSYFPVNHTEYVRIPGTSLQPVAGRYRINVTEELSEVSYLDQIQLSAVDHPAGTEIYSNDKFKGPPYPEFRLYPVKQRTYPIVARDGDGRDVLRQVTARDRRYPDQFQRSETGVAELHSLELDFGGAAPAGTATLLLNGWVDWPDGSTFRRASQESKGGLVMPYLQAQDRNGRWVTIDSDMGMPAGKPKTIAVPVRFPAASRKLRIVTNLCVYWDEIFLSESGPDAALTPHPVPLVTADLHYRGFSKTRIDPRRLQPDTFVYGKVTASSFWNPTPGLYTRFGAVDDLLRSVDDRLVLMGSGDEIRLQFDASKLPALPAGWSRDFLLKVDGWAKDRDPNTAYSQTVLPLPFHGMSRYPYPPDEQFPRDPAHDEYQRTYNTRPATKVISSLEQP